MINKLLTLTDNIAILAVQYTFSVIFLNTSMSPSPVIPSRAFLFPGFESFYVLQRFMPVDAGLSRQGGTNRDDFDNHGRYGALVA